MKIGWKIGRRVLGEAFLLSQHCCLHLEGVDWMSTATTKIYLCCCLSRDLAIERKKPRKFTAYHSHIRLHQDITVFSYHRGVRPSDVKHSLQRLLANPHSLKNRHKQHAKQLRNHRFQAITARCRAALKLDLMPYRMLQKSIGCYSIPSHKVSFRCLIETCTPRPTRYAD